MSILPRPANFVLLLHPRVWTEEEEELVPEPEEATARSHGPAPGGQRGACRIGCSQPGFVELERGFGNGLRRLEDDLEDGAPVTGLVEEEEVTDEEEYDFTPLYVESEDHDLQELEEETLDQEVAAGGAIGEMVRDAHLDQRIDGDASGLMVEEEEAEDELETARGRGRANRRRKKGR